MTTRFDLEQEILKFSQILEDLKSLKLSDAATLNDQRKINVIVEYYAQKFDELWETFEQSIRDEHETRNRESFITKAQIVPVTRIEVIDENGRSYSKWNITNKTFSFQDENKTLKIFLNMKGEASSEDLSNQA